VVVDGQVSQDLAVNLDASLPQPVDKAAVREAGVAGGRVNAGDPQSAEIPLAIAAVPISIRERLHHGLVGRAEDGALSPKIALGLLEHLLMAAPGYRAAFGPWHRRLPPSNG